MVVLENSFCRIAFDSGTGGLHEISNRRTGDSYLKRGKTGAMPFRIYADLIREFEIGINEKFQLVFDDPEASTRTIVEPGTCRRSVTQDASNATLRYDGHGFSSELRVVLAEDSGASDWSLRITNTAAAPRQFLVSFPYIEGVRLGPNPSNNLATAMDMAGVVIPAWERAGGVLGESNQFSMQWHAIWDPDTQNAFGMIFRDADVRPKRIMLHEDTAAIELHYFPPATLASGESLELPSVRMVVYEGDWRPAARAYRSWYDHAYAHVTPPAWFRRSNGNVGAHFRKGGPEITSTYYGQHVIQTYRELPALRVRCPVDSWEYAFYCRTSMAANDCAYTPHTDGENIIREDLGGPAAMRDGIAAAHRLGLHSTMYIDGYLMHEDCDLARAGKGREWAVVHKDGSITGPYSFQGFYHMCAGCEEWQDNLARTVARLLRETNADAVRLDSLGFYYLPCYNPAHRHDTPFGYNDWLKCLLARVRQAAVAVKPDVLLLTEGPADWIGQWFHGALTARCPRDLPMMRLAVGPFRTYVYASGALWGALAGLPGGGCESPDIHHIDWNWICARFMVHETMVWGDVADHDPLSSDPEIVTRCFVGSDHWAIVAARPACQDPIWPRGTGISSTREKYTLTLPGMASDVEDAVLCDVETLAWSSLEVDRFGADIRVHLTSNWALVILRRSGASAVVGFDPLPALRPGTSTTIRPMRLSRGACQNVSVKVSAPGLVVTPELTEVSREVTIAIPADALPGYYAVEVSGVKTLGMKRFLIVENEHTAMRAAAQGPVIQAKVHGELHD